MALKRETGPAADGTGIELVSLSSDGSSPTTSAIKLQAAARLAVEEMLAAGACFSVSRREDGSASFLYELRSGGSRRRCREILRAAKKADGVYWRAFVETIVAHVGSAS